MNRNILSSIKALSRMSLSGPASSSIYPTVPHLPRNVPACELPKSMDLPALENPRQVYILPVLNKTPLIAPTVSTSLLIEKLAPSILKKEIMLPPHISQRSMHLSPRLLTIRRKKMKKHKRRRRFNRDFFKYQKYHREKKLKAEREYLKRMKGLLSELETFNPEKYVEQTIAMAKKEWQEDLAPTGRKLYPHWSRLMSLEQLYGLPNSEYIDKKAGLPTPEDAEKIAELKAAWAAQYRKK